jgi:hypothetical protein
VRESTLSNRPRKEHQGTLPAPQLGVKNVRKGVTSKGKAQDYDGDGQAREDEVQGVVTMYWAPRPVSMWPQEGGGSEIPNPRKFRPASDSITAPNIEDIMIRKNANALGITWPNMIRRSEVPPPTPPYYGPFP